MTIEELAPYFDALTDSTNQCTETVFAVGVLLAAWFLYSLFWRR